jgi:hypothetical protein
MAAGNGMVRSSLNIADITAGSDTDKAMHRSLPLMRLGRFERGRMKTTRKKGSRF